MKLKKLRNLSHSGDPESWKALFDVVCDGYLWLG